MRFHRLIALAWIPNPDNKPMVLHIDDDRTTYLINNLKWGTGKENQEGSMARRPDTMKQKYLDCINKGFIKNETNHHESTFTNHLPLCAIIQIKN